MATSVALLPGGGVSSSTTANSDSTSLQPYTTSTTPAAGTSGPSQAGLSGSASLTPTSNTPAVTSSTNGTTSGWVSSISSSSSTAYTSSSTRVTSSPNNTSSALHSSTNSTTLSTGAIAGVAIGCFLIGSLLGMGIILLFCRRKDAKSRRRRRSHYHGAVGGSAPPYSYEKDPSLHAPPSMTDFSSAPPVIGLGTTANNRSLDDLLPQQADDAYIRQKYVLIFDQIELHIDNFYTSSPSNHVPIRIGVDQEADLSRFSTPYLSIPLVGLLQMTHRPSTVLKHCLAYYVLRLVWPSKGTSSSTESLLPNEIKSMLQGISYNPKASDDNHALALATWRPLTAYLRPDIFSPTSTSTNPYPNRPSSSDFILSSTSAAITTTATRFTQAFHPFSHPSHSNTDRQHHLEDLLKNALQTALMLFSQASSFEIEWSKANPAGGRNAAAGSGTSGDGLLVTVPSLIKTYDQRGRKINSGMVIVDRGSERI